MPVRLRGTHRPYPDRYSCVEQKQVEPVCSPVLPVAPLRRRLALPRRTTSRRHMNPTAASPWGTRHCRLSRNSCVESVVCRTVACQSWKSHVNGPVSAFARPQLLTGEEPHMNRGTHHRARSHTVARKPYKRRHPPHSSSNIQFLWHI